MAEFTLRRNGDGTVSVVDSATGLDERIEIGADITAKLASPATEAADEESGRYLYVPDGPESGRYLYVPEDGGTHAQAESGRYLYVPDEDGESGRYLYTPLEAESARHLHVPDDEESGRYLYIPTGGAGSAQHAA